MHMKAVIIPIQSSVMWPSAWTLTTWVTHIWTIILPMLSAAADNDTEECLSSELSLTAVQNTDCYDSIWVEGSTSA